MKCNIFFLALRFTCSFCVAFAVLIQCGLAVCKEIEMKYYTDSDIHILLIFIYWAMEQKEGGDKHFTMTTEAAIAHDCTKLEQLSRNCTWHERLVWYKTHWKAIVHRFPFYILSCLCVWEKEREAERDGNAHFIRFVFREGNIPVFSVAAAGQDKLLFFRVIQFFLSALCSLHFHYTICTPNHIHTQHTSHPCTSLVAIIIVFLISHLSFLLRFVFVTGIHSSTILQWLSTAHFIPFQWHLMETEWNENMFTVWWTRNDMYSKYASIIFRRNGFGCNNGQQYHVAES